MPIPAVSMSCSLLPVSTVGILWKSPRRGRSEVLSIAFRCLDSSQDNPDVPSYASCNKLRFYGRARQIVATQFNACIDIVTHEFRKTALPALAALLQAGYDRSSLIQAML